MMTDYFVLVFFPQNVIQPLERWRAKLKKKIITQFVELISPFPVHSYDYDNAIVC